VLHSVHKRQVPCCAVNKPVKYMHFTSACNTTNILPTDLDKEILHSTQQNAFSTRNVASTVLSFRH